MPQRGHCLREPPCKLFISRSRCGDSTQLRKSSKHFHTSLLPLQVLLELFGHASPGTATGLLDAWAGVSLVEQLERGQLSNKEFYQAVTSASGGWGGGCCGRMAGFVLRQIWCALGPSL